MQNPDPMAEVREYLNAMPPSRRAWFVEATLQSVKALKMMKENAMRMGNAEGARFYHMALQFKILEANKTQG